MVLLDRSDWILAYLYSPGRTGKVNEPVEGSVPLMKGLFLLQNELHEKVPYTFKPDMYGPLSLEVYDDINTLTAGKGEVVQESRVGQRWKTFRLNERGLAEAEEVYRHLPEPTRKSILEVKTRISSFSMTELLDYVYERYPDFARNSILRIPR